MTNREAIETLRAMHRRLGDKQVELTKAHQRGDMSFQELAKATADILKRRRSLALGIDALSNLPER